MVYFESFFKGAINAVIYLRLFIKRRESVDLAARHLIFRLSHLLLSGELDRFYGIYKCTAVPHRTNRYHLCTP